MTKNLSRLLWRRYRQRFWALLGISVLAGIAVALLDAETWVRHSPVLFADQINHWVVYQTSKFGSVSVYSYWLVFVAWLSGMLLMMQDLKENFNQFLFASGYKRQRIYWTKLGMALAGLLVIDVVTAVVQYLTYWIKLPQGTSFNLALPGFLTTWVSGLILALVMFAIGWFAALIVGQSGPLVITVCGFTLSLVGMVTFFEGVTLHMTTITVEWLAVGSWLLAAVILLVWGSFLFNRLSLEHNGEYLMFPRLRVPLYLVFVGYMTFIFSVNANDLQPALITFIISAIFGYGWLWRPQLIEKWHQRRGD
ncbi:ABC transporter permease [Levilactobacillus acidifarinae]|uniref:ABC transporter permease n=1 Tax=Levilactobacillus acidifarinae TaxID=267364 RepID=UPI0011BEF5A2|nr:ABC transporter permease [Levilactobacillus acidifarinae]